MDTDWPLGTAVVERSVLRAIDRLWDGGFRPGYLAQVELGLRAFVVAPRLVVSRTSGDPYGSYVNPARPDIEYDEPFHDHLLDYEFIKPDKPHPYVTPGVDEWHSLQQLIDERIRNRIFDVIPSWIKTQSAAAAYVGAWYAGKPPSECAAAALEEGIDGPPLIRTPDEFEHAIFHLGPVNEAMYLVGCHRAGLLIFAATPVAGICEEHVFSVWPNKIFELLGRDFDQLARQIAGPKISFRLPPLLTVVLSRANRRSDIPHEIVALREEFETSRRQLWATLDEMWNATTIDKQLKIARTLEAAATSIVGAAYRDKVNALRLGVGIASGSLAQTAGTLLQYDEPVARVSAVSFAKQISCELRKNATNQRTALKRHLDSSELGEFGIGD